MSSTIDFTSRQLRAFLLVAQHHSFTRAAEALFITPSGLSVLIRELEKQLGFRLFDRTTRHVELTSQGSHLLITARRSLEDLDSAVSDIGQTARQSSQSLSVGAFPWAAANIMPQAIKQFCTQHPDMRIQLFDADLTTLSQKVAAGTLDIGFGFFKNVPGIRRTPLFRFPMVVIRPDSGVTPHRATTTWSALKGDRLLSMPAISPVQQQIDKHLARAGVVSETVMVFNQIDTVIAMVGAGQGIAIVPSITLPAVWNRGVVMSRLINPTVHLDWHQIRSRGKKLPVAAEDFTSFVQNYIARWAGRAGIL
jgi:DNA-binding transcriptional LysR family regulator